MQAGAELDDALIRASRSGDRDAFAQIIERYQRAVYAVAFSGTRDRALADDVTQDAFVIAWRRLAELRDTERLAAWLCGIARNVARDARRRHRRETPAEIDDAAGAPTPLDAITDAETERILAAALGEVPDVYREPLVLYYYEERSIDDVARSLGISTATTNKRLSRGRRYLADRVATVERTLTRRGPVPGLAASVLALVGLSASASHVDASPAAVKGSTMHKLTIAAVATASLAGGGLVVVKAVDGAHAKTSAASTTARDTSPNTAGTHTAAAPIGAHAKPGTSCAPSLKALLGGLGASAHAASDSDGDASDCEAVGEHLAQLEADAMHEPTNPRDEQTHVACAAYYVAQCEAGAWSEERRACTLAAADVVNAHLCAGRAPSQPIEPPAEIPASLSCAAISTHIGTTLHQGGLFSEVSDLPAQMEAACESGSWSLATRQCFVAATTVDALHACITPQ
jgi:RNA polymerase sigma factor (sigma-70 family)